ncbi:MAG: DUF5689 domain-containing protein [Tenuifilaceae bacterium]
MKKKLLSILLPFVLFGYMMFQGGCVKEDFDVVPSLIDTSSLVKTASIAEVKALLVNTANVYKVKNLASPSFRQTIKERNIANNVIDTASIVIEGYVTSSDSTGNFYEVVTIQDQTGGIDIKINVSALYSNYRLKPGQKVLVKVNDLYIGFYRGVYQLGSAFVELGALKITGLTLAELPKFIERSGVRKKVEPIDLTINQINSTHVQKLVRINNVQFWSPSNAFSIPGENTNRTLIDCNGKMLILRTSGYSSFTNETVPSGNGSITGVLSIYDATYQLYIRDLQDIQFNNPRCGSEIPTKNKTIAELKAMWTTIFKPINENVVISGVVNSNDESGNLYKQLFIQDESGGIEFKVDIAGMYPEFPVGTKVVINCNGLYLGKYGGVVQLGGDYNGSIGRLSPSIFYQKVFTVESGLPVTPVVTTIATLNDANIGKLISIDEVQFIDSDMGKPWADANTTTNRYVEDFQGKKLIVRTSSFSNFANNILPSGKGKITAILTKFNSDYQLTIREMADIRLIKPRVVKTYLINQDFSSATLNQPISVGGWQTIAAAGTKKWNAKSYSGDNYAEMNPYQSGEASNIAWLISPQVNLAGPTTKYLSFDTQYNYWASVSSLQAFISTDFNGTNVAAATWTPLSGARLVIQSDGTNKWINSGLVDLSQYTGNIYLGFKYISSGGTNATAFRVDNVKIFSSN